MSSEHARPDDGRAPVAGRDESGLGESGLGGSGIGESGRATDLTLALDEVDDELVGIASMVVRERYRPGWHFVGCALRTRSGRVFTGVNLGAYVSRIGVCAEVVALGQAIVEGDHELDRVVAVFDPGSAEPDTPPRVVAPCGMCRELLSDYGPDVSVILPWRGAVRKTSIGALLPEKYTRA